MCGADKHQYEARYENILNQKFYRYDLSGLLVSSKDVKALGDALTERIYVCDICTKCGDIVNRK